MKSDNGQTTQLEKRTPLWLRPFVAIERARGRQRLLLILLGLAVLSILVSFIVRHASLAGLRDVGDPFDVKEYLASQQVPDDQNAMVLYRQAMEALATLSRDTVISLNSYLNDMPNSYSAAQLELKANPETIHTILKCWLEGTNKPVSAVEMSGEHADLSGQLYKSHDFYDRDALLMIGKLALLEAARLMDEGDCTTAWTYLRGGRRFITHLTDYKAGFLRLPPGTLRSEFDSLFNRWCLDPATPTKLLGDALKEIKNESQQLFIAADELKSSYIQTLEILRKLDGMSPKALEQLELEQPYNFLFFLRGGPAFYWFMKNEPERSIRITRLIYANWLSQADKHTTVMEAAEPNPLRLFDTQTDRSAQPAARALDVPSLYCWHNSSIVLRLMIRLSTTGAQSYQIYLRELLRRMRLKLAEELFLREHGRASVNLEELSRDGNLDEVPDEVLGEPDAKRQR